MKTNMIKYAKLFLRVSIAAAFLSAVMDRFGLWPEQHSVWGNWKAFIAYTGTINPWFPEALIPFIGVAATVAEALFAFFLLIGFRTRFFALASGALLLVFALAMSFSIGIKAPLDYSVFTAAAAAFSLAGIKEKFLEIDEL